MEPIKVQLPELGCRLFRVDTNAGNVVGVTLFPGQPGFEEHVPVFTERKKSWQHSWTSADDNYRVSLYCRTNHKHACVVSERGAK